jgi:hypothetical protein
MVATREPLHPPDLGQADRGPADAVCSLLPVPDRHRLILGGYDVITWADHGGRGRLVAVASLGEALDVILGLNGPGGVPVSSLE